MRVCAYAQGPRPLRRAHGPPPFARSALCAGEDASCSAAVLQCTCAPGTRHLTPGSWLWLLALASWPSQPPRACEPGRILHSHAASTSTLSLSTSECRALPPCAFLTPCALTCVCPLPACPRSWRAPPRSLAVADPRRTLTLPAQPSPALDLAPGAAPGAAPALLTAAPCTHIPLAAQRLLVHHCTSFFLLLLLLVLPCSSSLPLLPPPPPLPPPRLLLSPCYSFPLTNPPTLI